MTIRNRELNGRLSNLERCAELAPEGTYDDAKALAACLGGIADNIIAEFRALGFEANGTDACRDLQAAVYGYFLASNPQAYGIMAAEGFGEHVDGPAGPRIIAQAASNRDFLAALIVRA